MVCGKCGSPDKRCLFCNGTGVMYLISGKYECYCVSTAKRLAEESKGMKESGSEQ